MDFGNVVASCREYTFLGPIQILKQSFGYTLSRRLILFLISKLSVITTFMESRFRSPRHLKIIPQFGWSYPEAQIATWMRYANQKTLPGEVAQESVHKEHSQGERSQDHIFIHQSVWEDLSAKDHSYGYKWETQVSKCVSKLVRHEHSRETETDGAINWKLTSPQLTIRFQRDGGRNFTDRDWINFIWIGSNKTRFQYCRNSCKRLLYLRAIQGHTGGNDSTRDAGPRPHTSQLEGVRVPSRMFVEFHIHIECLAHRRRTRRSFTPLDPWCVEEEKEYCRDLTRPRKVHHKTGWKHSQNAVYSIHLWESARERHTVFWQTKSHTTITNSTVPPDCIERVISPRGEMTN